MTVVAAVAAVVSFALLALTVWALRRRDRLSPPERDDEAADEPAASGERERPK